MHGRLRRILESGEPSNLLAEASNIIHLATERHPLDLLREEKPLPLDGIVEDLISIELVETSSLLEAIRILIGPTPLQKRITDELAKRRPVLPEWVNQLDQIELVTTAQMNDVFGDGDNLLVTVRFPSGKTMTAMTYVDHNMGTVAKDGFVVAVGIEKLGDSLDRSGESDIHFDFLEPADARARIEQAIAAGDLLFPPMTTDQWPASRPLIEWIIHHLPAGGRPYTRRDWSERERRQVLDAFLATDEGRGTAADPDRVDIVRTLIDFACDYGAGDPMRWSPIAVEMFLADWFPRKVIADQQYRDKIPDTMLAFVRYCHRESSFRTELTEETTDAIWRWARYTTDREYDGFDDVMGGFNETQFAAAMLDFLADTVGGASVLDRLDADPAPDESFDWTGIPEDIRSEIEQVLHLTDRCCTELFDIEMRTLVRRLIARAATADSNLFRRRAKTENTAVTYVWMIGSENGMFPGYITVGELRAWFGLKGGSSSQRAETIRKAMGVSTYANRLADPRLLHSAYRRDLIARRDSLREMLVEPEESAPPPAGPARDVAIAIAWFPADQWDEARERLRLDHLPEDHLEYSRVIQSALEDAGRATARVAVAPLDVAELFEFARSRAVNPYSDEARSHLAAEMLRTNRAAPWPPGRNRPCWCGSTRKYKHCCGHPH